MVEINGLDIIRILYNDLHWSTEKGVRFIGTNMFQSLSSGSTKYYFVDFSGVPSNYFVEVHYFTISLDEPVVIHIYAQPTISSNGTAVQMHNANGKSTKANFLKIYADPDITDNGQEIHTLYISGASGGGGFTSGSGNALQTVTMYRILASSMLIGIENVSSNTINYASMMWDWKEEASV